jgi:hypothetical protein
MTSAIRPSQTWGKKVIPFSKSPKPLGIAKSPQLFGIRISGQRILGKPWKAFGRGKIYENSCNIVEK